MQNGTHSSTSQDIQTPPLQSILETFARFQETLQQPEHKHLMHQLHGDFIVAQQRVLEVALYRQQLEDTVGFVEQRCRHAEDLATMLSKMTSYEGIISELYRDKHRLQSEVMDLKAEAIAISSARSQNNNRSEQRLLADIQKRTQELRANLNSFFTQEEAEFASTSRDLQNGSDPEGRQDYLKAKQIMLESKLQLLKTKESLIDDSQGAEFMSLMKKMMQSYGNRGTPVTAQIKEENEWIKEENEQMRALESSLQSSSALITQLEQEVLKLNGQLEQSRNQNKAHAEQLRDKQQQLSCQNARILHLEGLLEKQKMLMGEYREGCEQQSKIALQKLNQYAQRQEKQEKRICELLDTVSQYEAAKRDREEQWQKQIKIMVGQHKTQLDKLQSEAQVRLREQVGIQIQRMKDQQQAEIKEMQSMLETGHKSVIEQQRELTSKITSLQNERQALQHKIEQITGEYGLKLAVCESERESEKAVLSSRLHASNNENKQLTEQLNTLRSSIAAKLNRRQRYSTSREICVSVESTLIQSLLSVEDVEGAITEQIATQWESCNIEYERIILRIRQSLAQSVQHHQIQPLTTQKSLKCSNTEEIKPELYQLFEKANRSVEEAGGLKDRVYVDQPHSEVGDRKQPDEEGQIQHLQPLMEVQALNGVRQEQAQQLVCSQGHSIKEQGTEHIGWRGQQAEAETNERMKQMQVEPSASLIQQERMENETHHVQQVNSVKQQVNSPRRKEEPLQNPFEQQILDGAKLLQNPQISYQSSANFEGQLQRSDENQLSFIEKSEQKQQQQPEGELIPQAPQEQEEKFQNPVQSSQNSMQPTFVASDGPHYQEQDAQNLQEQEVGGEQAADRLADKEHGEEQQPANKIKEERPQNEGEEQIMQKISSWMDAVIEQVERMPQTHGRGMEESHQDEKPHPKVEVSAHQPHVPLPDQREQQKIAETAAKCEEQEAHNQLLQETHSQLLQETHSQLLEEAEGFNDDQL